MRRPLKNEMILFAIRALKEFIGREGPALISAQISGDQRASDMRVMFDDVFEKHNALITYLLNSNPEDVLLEEHKQMLREEIELVLRVCPSGNHQGQVVTLLIEGPLEENQI